MTRIDWSAMSAPSVPADVRGFYAELDIGLGNPSGVEANVRCFAAPESHKRDDRNPSCSINLSTGLFRCHGCGARGNAYAAALSVGRPEHIARQLAQRYGLYLEGAKDRPKRAPGEKPGTRRARMPRLPTEKQLEKQRAVLLAQPAFLERLAELKGWTLSAIVACNIGWDGERLTFPIRDQALKLIDVVRYLPGGSPKVLGGAGRPRGLFPAPEALSRRRVLFVVEGEPAAVSIFSTGHQAVGVPGKDSWRAEWAKRLNGRRLVILPDCDPEGRELAYHIKTTLPMARLVDIDPALSDGTDIGDWIAEAHRLDSLSGVGRMLSSIAEGI